MIATRCVTAAVSLFLMTAILPVCVHAQKGIAGPGYYPSGYNGDIFTGEFAPSDSADQIKLVYKNGNKTQSFEGKIESPCLAPLKDKPTAGKELHLSSIPAGTGAKYRLQFSGLCSSQLWTREGAAGWGVTTHQSGTFSRRYAVC